MAGLHPGQIRVEGTVIDVALVNPEAEGSWPYLAITFEYDNDATQRMERKTRRLSFTENAIGYTENDLRTLGWDPTKNAWGVDDMIANETLIGAKAELVIGPRPYKGQDPRYVGKTFEEIIFVNAIGGGIKNRATNDDARSFTAKLRQKLGVPTPASAGIRKPTSTPATKPMPAAAKPAPAAKPQPVAAPAGYDPNAAPAPADDEEGIPF